LSWGLPFALVFSVLSALAKTVPYIGALDSGVPPVVFALTISSGIAASSSIRVRSRTPPEAMSSSPRTANVSVSPDSPLSSFGVSIDTASSVTVMPPSPGTSAAAYAASM
jgi:hypothetical protein